MNDSHSTAAAVIGALFFGAVASLLALGNNQFELIGILIGATSGTTLGILAGRQRAARDHTSASIRAAYVTAFVVFLLGLAVPRLGLAYFAAFLSASSLVVVFYAWRMRSRQFK
jgi:predicted membrane-bound spermidine synthase